MDSPKITWYILENEDYIQDPDYYLGSYTTDSTISINVQVWNNRYGQKASQSIENARLSIYFENIENSILLQYCEVNVNNNFNVTPDIEVGRGTAYIGELYGSANNGIANEENRNNYKNINITFKNLPYNLINGIKNMFLDIEID